MSSLLRSTVLTFALLLSGLYAENQAYAEPFENYSAFGGEVERDPNRQKGKGCSRLYYCGPTSTVTLSMHASDQDAFNYNMGEKGTFEQMMQRGEEYKNFDALSMTEKIEKSRAAHNAPKIKIVFPMIDYGYSGTFNNILITTSSSGLKLKTAKKDEFSEGHTGFTGTITIEEYSPYVMKGSYSGELYSYVGTNAPYRGPLPSKREKQIKISATGSVNGEFNILSPWKGDARMNDGIESPLAIVDPMKNDIKRLAAKYGIDVDIDKEFEAVEANAQRNARGPSSSSNVYGDCNCSCNFTQSTAPKCQTTCRAAFDVCQGERYTSPVRETAINKIDLSPELQEASENYTLKDSEKLMNLDQETIARFENNAVKTPTNLRDKFIVLLEQLQPGSANAPARASMLQGFDSMPDEKSKMVMFMSLGGKE